MFNILIIILFFHSVLRDSILDCLVDLGLTGLLSELGNVPEFLVKLGSGGDDSTSYTFFAPSNEAFNDLSDLDRPSSQTILGGHIINRSEPIFTNRLRQGKILTPIDNQFSLHVTTVSASRSDRVSMEEIFNLTPRDLLILSLSSIGCIPEWSTNH